LKQLSPSLRSRADLEILRAVAPELESIIGADVLALGFTKNSEGSISFNGSKKLLNSIQSYFEINLVDEVSFFSPSAKAGELFEIPVLLQLAERYEARRSK
jgi:leucyl aminopeptidase